MARSVVDLAGERLGLAGVGGWLLGPFAGVCGGACVLARDVSWCRRGRFLLCVRRALGRARRLHLGALVHGQCWRVCVADSGMVGRR